MIFYKFWKFCTSKEIVNRLDRSTTPLRPVQPVTMSGQTSLLGRRSPKAEDARRGCLTAAFSPAELRAAAGKGGNSSSRGRRPPCARPWRRSPSQGMGRRAGSERAARRCSGGGDARCEGKKVGEHEWVTGMLTVVLDWTEEGWERELDGESRALG
jgi:hypothetical protein